jgi:hypothetical protein
MTELTRSEEKLVKWVLRERWFSLQRRTTLWGVASSIFAVLIPFSYFYANSKYLNLILFLWLVSFSFCSSSYLVNIIRKIELRPKTKLDSKK